MKPRTKPKLGQNFLRDTDAQRRVVAALGNLSGQTVLEIGPGHGVLTDLLAPHCRRLLAVELDANLATELRLRFVDQPSVSIIEGDVLTTDLCRLLAEEPGAHIIGNLPYYITSEILLELFDASERCRLGRAVLMMQHEVAERVTASPGVSDFGVLSATAQMHAQAEMLFTLPPAAFSPQPDVDSTVVRFEFHARFDELAVDRGGFIAFLRASFAQKRKTLGNNLRAAGVPAGVVEEAWPEALDSAVRAEAVPLETMALLYRELRDLAPSAIAPLRVGHNR